MKACIKITGRSRFNKVRREHIIDLGIYTYLKPKETFNQFGLDRTLLKPICIL